MPSNPNRRDARHDYRHFPTEYADIITSFAATHGARYGPFNRAEVHAMRRDLYRYFGFLRNADTSDQFARDLSDIACTIVCRVVADSGPMGIPEETGYWLELSLNPLVRELRRDATHRTTKGHPTPAHPIKV